MNKQKQAETLYEDSHVIVKSFTFECGTCMYPGTQKATLVLVTQPFGMHLTLSAWEGEHIWTWMITSGHKAHVLLVDQPVDSPVRTIRIEFGPYADQGARHACDEYHELDVDEADVDAKVLDLFCGMLHEDIAPVFRETYATLMDS